MQMNFKDKEYALKVWTPPVIAGCEALWKQERVVDNSASWLSDRKVDALIPVRNKNVLDVGCGVGYYYDLLSRKTEEYIGIDVTDNMIKRARELHPSGDFRVGSILNLPFLDDSFDLVFCWDVLIHFPGEMTEELVGNLCRVSRNHVIFNIYISVQESTITLPSTAYETRSTDEKMLGIIEKLANFELEKVRPSDAGAAKTFKVYLLSRR